MRRQAGVAAVTAILIVAVAATAATLMLSQQGAMLEQASLIASRAQADGYAQAGLDWARGILAEHARAAGSAPVDSLAEPWAQPIVGLPVERALIAGAISDEQGKFNLNNLFKENRRSEADLEIFRQLLNSLGLDPELRFAVLDWIDPDSDLSGAGGAEDAYYLSLARPYRAANQPMVQVEELYRVRGFDSKVVARLMPYVTALPGHTAVNVNTASEIVLGAVLPKMPREEIAQRLRSRAAKPFRNQADIASWASQAEPAALGEALDVKSSYFSVRVQVAQDDVEVSTEALLQRSPNGATAIVWRRPRY
ncbi:MAG TPA: type II secretion system minor pseudopilin GspK [Usitatibacter sp.]|nr:type II secretion system minor pseudopilin GspK [Usitatibacter sp.]